MLNNQEHNQTLHVLTTLPYLADCSTYVSINVECYKPRVSMFIFRPILSSHLMAVCRRNGWGKLNLPDSTQETHKIPNVNNKTELV